MNEMDKTCSVLSVGTVLPYFGKRKQVTYHLNLSYWDVFVLYLVCSSSRPNYMHHHLILFCLQDEDMPCNTSWFSIDVSGNDKCNLLFYKKFHFCHLLPFARVGQYAWKQTHEELVCKKQTPFFKRLLKTNVWYIGTSL